ncbi:MAG: acyclic terpene utilization AtuA family protein [Hyphomicrobiales bacterium]|nr:acyclic terpene utilization AtuA family protein [Hyphomicrobiales bacterium]MBV8823603.1 acyclic terpene utilization AtuA family protein [Hyphomicrobiales bacterium]MBV9429761.1 acyclic terpene utilization AtuA family protein [Bradyrhizobiaceae bacterium]
MTIASDVQRVNRGLRILCPNGHLGFAPTKLGSFERGLTAEPDLIACDSGSCDCGPIPLGTDSSTSPLAWQRHDIEAMLLGARRLGVPMVIGSAGDTGTNSRVDRYVGIVKELAEQHKLKAFTVGYFYSEVSKDAVRQKIVSGDAVRGLDGRPDLSLAELDATDRIVAVAGVHPYIKLLDQGADVIIGGRSSDSAIFAAPALRQGYPPALAYYYGKILECASFCAEPYGAKESVMGEITMQDVKVTAMLPEQRCTVASVAAHAMYERSNPYYEYFLGGHIDMRECVYEQFDERTTRVTGPRYVAADELRVKLEGAGKVGERCVGIVGIRDPYTISRIDEVIAWARNAVRERFGNAGYELAYTVYGRDGVMGELEPLRDRPAHELCVVVQGVAPTKEMAEEVCMAGSRQMFYARLPDVKGTAGGVAFLLDEVMRASPAYRWTLNHTMRIDDPCELFTLHLTAAGA